ncbi:hypothetical protein Y032_0320g2391 [Ancylostoma ceylanicum]|uniref:Secreted protein n=1 Tax=Ancylostoma ceylanicum TaxID=53326 RepID=A0A016S188_9BILA|nr:hypothetical protein Y032_0320g2391 [Ancylostoma ceylanicum]
MQSIRFDSAFAVTAVLLALGHAARFHDNYRKKQAIKLNDTIVLIGEQWLRQPCRVPIEPLSRQMHCRNNSTVQSIRPGVEVASHIRARVDPFQSCQKPLALHHFN